MLFDVLEKTIDERMEMSARSWMSETIVLTLISVILFIADI